MYKAITAGSKLEITYIGMNPQTVKASSNMKIVLTSVRTVPSSCREWLRKLIFGMLTPEVNNLKQVGYHPNAFITGDDVANYTLNFLERGWNGENFHEVTENLRTSDPYMVMADFKDYRRAQADLQKLYGDREKWAQMSLKNTANSGIFSADRAVLDYARDIWHASTVPMGK